MLRSPLRSPFVDLLRPSVGVAGLSIVQQAIGILRKYGTDAHIYLPGIGTVSGLTAGNYLDSAGTTPATIDNPVGLVIDPLGAVNATQATTANKPILRRGLLNLLTYSHDLTNAAWPKLSCTISTGQTDPYGGTTAQKIVDSADGAPTVHALNRVSATAGIAQTFIAIAKPSGRTEVALQLGSSATYFNVSTGAVVSGSGSSAPIGGGFFLCVMSGTPANLNSIIYPSVAGSVSYTGDGTSGLILAGTAIINGTYTAQQIIDAGGIPLTTAAAASSSTGKYWAQFDSTDLLTATYPAGYESATIIDAVKSGVVTTQGVNVVGSYSIGPSVNTAGRILMRAAPTASELAVLQAYARSLI